MGSVAISKAVNIYDLAKSTIIVTGAGGGLGLELVTSILQQGADVACIDYHHNRPKQWDQLVDATRLLNNHLSYHSCDVVDTEAVDAVFKANDSTARYPIKGLVTCAGIRIEGPALDFPIQAARRQVDENLIGTLACAQAAARRIKTAGHEASFVFISSMSGHIVNTDINVAAYPASKAAVLQLARNLAAKWGSGDAPIRVNTISPGYIKTPLLAKVLDEEREARWADQNMLGRLSLPSNYCGPAIFLLSNASAYITGTDLLVDGGHCAY